MQTPYTDAKVTSQYATAAANNAVVITLAADTEEIHALHGLQASYSETPTGGVISVAIDGTTVFSSYILGTTFDIEFTQPIYGAKDQAMVITLAAGAGTAVGKLSVQTS